MRGGVPVPSRLGDAQPPHPATAEVIAVWGPAGAPGRTTLAVNLAAELAASGHSVALVDADPYGGAIAPVARPARRGARLRRRRAASPAASALDRVELERIAQRYSRPAGVVRRVHRASSARVAGPSSRASASRPRSERCRALGRVRRARYAASASSATRRLTSDLFAPRRNAATFAALAEADRVVAVGLGRSRRAVALAAGPRRPASTSSSPSASTSS